MNYTNNPAKVVLDTNFIVDLFRFKLGFDDIEDAVGMPCDFIVVRKSVEELKRMKNKHAKVGLSFVSSGKVRVIDIGGRTADDAILSLLASRKDLKKLFIATNDAKLRKKVYVQGARIIYLRARKQLEVSQR